MPQAICIRVRQMPQAICQHILFAIVTIHRRSCMAKEFQGLIEIVDNNCNSVRHGHGAKVHTHMCPTESGADEKTSRDTNRTTLIHPRIYMTEFMAIEGFRGKRQAFLVKEHCLGR